MRPTFWPFLQTLQSSLFEEINGGHYCSICRDLPSMSNCPLCMSTRFTNSIVPKMSIVGSLLIGENPSRCTIYVIALGVRDHISIWPRHPSFVHYVHYVHLDHHFQLSKVASILIGAGMLWGCVTVVPSGQDLLHCFGSPHHCPTEPPSAEPH